MGLFNRNKKTDTTTATPAATTPPPCPCNGAGRIVKEKVRGTQRVRYTEPCGCGA